jgi:hypothetical protein
MADAESRVRITKVRILRKNPDCFLVLFAAVCLAQLTDRPYKILSTEKSALGEHPRSVSIRVSVEKRLEKTDLEKLICELINTEKPENYDRLSIAFYYMLDEYIPPLEHQGLTRKQQERLLSSYIWDRKLPVDRYALAIFMDRYGKSFQGGPQFIQFDHFQNCK